MNEPGPRSHCRSNSGRDRLQRWIGKPLTITRAHASSRLAHVAAGYWSRRRNIDDALEALNGRRQQQHGIVDGAADRGAAAEQLPRRASIASAKALRWLGP